MDILTELTGNLASLLWNNGITMLILVGTGLYLTIRLRFIQFSGFVHAFRLIRGIYHKPGDPGEVTHFQALSTALSATVGTGNIAGVATAISLGGPGALFWMWVTAFVGMATKFTESTLALKFREIDDNGEVSGGPMYTLLHGLKMRRTAMVFATFALIASFGIGNLVQANSVVDGLAFMWPDLREQGWWIGLILSILVGLVILGGVKRIAKVASTIVPFMAMTYVFAALVVLMMNIEAVPTAFSTIFNSALNISAVGAAAIGEAMRWGVARGLFSNEAGLGSSPMAHAAAKTQEPVREGLVAMMEPFVDTLVICSMTGLVIVVTGAYLTADSNTVGAALTAYAFSQSMGDGGAVIVGFGLILFAFSTMIAWSYYGDRSARFLFGDQAVMPYRVLYTSLIIVGAAVPLNLVWNIADITTILMALPNLLAVFLLSALVLKMKNDYFKRLNKEETENV